VSGRALPPCYSRSDIRERRIRAPHPLKLPLVAVACSVAVAACGSSAKPSNSASSPLAATHSAALKFSACMRTHGEPNFPDPTSGGQTVGPVDKNSPAFRNAQQACRRPLRALAAIKPPRNRSGQLRYAECMRAHGETNFPDPLPGGGFTVPSTVDPQSPAFIAADKACSRIPR
jgi:hypothetical protein